MRNLEGLKFNNFTVIKRTGTTSSGHAQWLCECDCGNKITLGTSHITRTKGAIKSCGCIKQKKGKDSPFFRGFEDIHGAWWSIHVRNPARRRSIDLNITIEEAWNKFVEQNRKCALTGLDLIFSKDSIINTASLDRIDNGKPYNLDNIQWIHKDINRMKSVFDNEYYIDMCRLVAKIV